MRITSGKLKGSILNSKKKRDVRPTMQKTREALFSILSSKGYMGFETPSRVLDLFCGLGSISLEFLSREIGWVTGVDKSRTNISFIKKNLEKLDCEKDAQLICADVFRWVSKNNSPKQKYDIVFLDPPYQMDAQKLFRLIANIFELNYVAPDGIVVMEHTYRLNVNVRWSYFLEMKRYGTSCLSFFKETLD